MAIYVVTGKLGAGKTLACVGRIRDALKAGRRVATNLDLRLENMLSRKGQHGTCIRLPDKPTVDDLESMGSGNPDYDESKNGLIVLDELGAWLNTRSWGDKERQPVIDWLLHSRKFGWDVFFIIQHANMVDKQVREGLAEFLVTCKRTDRLRIPLVGGLLKTLFRKEVKLPQMHVASVRYGIDPQALLVDRWYYRARDLYAAYDTRQVFTNDRTGLYTYLPPSYIPEPRAPARRSLWARLAAPRADAQQRPVVKPKRPEVEALMRLPPERRLKLLRFVDPVPV